MERADATLDEKMRIENMLDRLSQWSRDAGHRNTSRYSGGVIDVLEMLVEAVADIRSRGRGCQCPCAPSE